ncbi:hypothetical protein R4B61_00275 [Fructilactobacillus vespulae]|uniref:hypothetical protein n=1 Tax=Fructilactobacillus vespulae TaxID=1249630 RepID=UPI0039B6A7E3
MNFIDIIVAVVTAVGSGTVAWITAKNNSTAQKEGIYADHTEKLFDKLDATIDERDELKEQVSQLKIQVSELTKIVERLKEEMGEK